MADPSNGQSPAWPLEAATAADLASEVQSGLRRLRQQPTLRRGLGGVAPPAEAGRYTTLSSRVLILEGSVSHLTVGCERESPRLIMSTSQGSITFFRAEDCAWMRAIHSVLEDPQVALPTPAQESAQEFCAWRGNRRSRSRRNRRGTSAGAGVGSGLSSDLDIGTRH